MSNKKSNPNQNAMPFANDFLLYQTEDGRTRIEVRLQDESVWLTQATLTELFQNSKQNISLHIQNILRGRRAGIGGNCQEILDSSP